MGGGEDTADVEWHLVPAMGLRLDARTGNDAANKANKPRGLNGKTRRRVGLT